MDRSHLRPLPHSKSPGDCVIVTQLLLSIMSMRPTTLHLIQNKIIYPESPRSTAGSSDPRVDWAIAFLVLLAARRQVKPILYLVDQFVIIMFSFDQHSTEQHSLNVCLPGPSHDEATCPLCTLSLHPYIRRGPSSTFS